MTQYNFCTYFDHNFLPRGLALYESLTEHCSGFHLWVLCLSEECFRAMTELKLPHVSLISLADLERGDEALLSAKRTRSQIEYYFTCTPSLPWYILKNYQDVHLITYLDADLFFFDDPQPIFNELGAGSVAIIGHRFPPRLKKKEMFGLYNVGWVSFRRDSDGLACLKWWRERCIEWCFDVVDGNRFADQRYLDEWPARFRGVAVIKHKGANLAPWNVENYGLSRSDRGMTVDTDNLVFYHFHGVKLIGNWAVDPNLKPYGVRADRDLQWLYAKYSRALRKAASQSTFRLNVKALNGIRTVVPQTRKRAFPFYITVRCYHAIQRFSVLVQRLMMRDYLLTLRR